MIMSRDTRKTTAAAVSLVSNIILTIAKLIAAVLSGSVSVLSEAVHSVGDIIASALAWMSVRVADKPADRDHPYGHGKVESLAGLAEALLLIGAAVFVGYEAVQRFAHPEAIQIDLALWVIVGTAVWNLFIGGYLRKVAVETDSEAIKADAAHITADVITSAGVVLALLLVRLTGNQAFDPVIAIALTLWILYSAGKIAYNSIEILIDQSLPENELALIRKILAEHKDVRSHHQLRTRKSGSHRHIDAHILLDDHLSLIEAHRITEQIEDEIRSALPNVSISLHMEPYEQEIEHRRQMHPPEEAVGK